MSELHIRTEALHCFKAYDIRGALGDELNEDIAYRIGHANISFFRPGRGRLGRTIG